MSLVVVAMWLCIAIAVVLTLAGAVLAASEGLRVKAHASRLQKSSLFSDIDEARVYAVRITTAFEAMRPLFARGGAAITRIRTSIQNMRIPQVMFTVRLVRASLRLLLS